MSLYLLKEFFVDPGRFGVRSSTARYLKKGVTLVRLSFSLALDFARFSVWIFIMKVVCIVLAAVVGDVFFYCLIQEKKKKGGTL